MSHIHHTCNDRKETVNFSPYSIKQREVKTYGGMETGVQLHELLTSVLYGDEYINYRNAYSCFSRQLAIRVQKHKQINQKRQVRSVGSVQ
jgi:hypothetical protein